MTFDPVTQGHSLIFVWALQKFTEALLQIPECSVPRAGGVVAALPLLPHSWVTTACCLVSSPQWSERVKAAGQCTDNNLDQAQKPFS